MAKSKRMQKTSLKDNQQGLVSFVVTIIVMLILSLIVLGFARLGRREQRQSLDRQLNTQAFYAAESGINDTLDYINTNLEAPGFVEEKDDCDPLPGYNPVISTEGPIEYTCVLYDSTPPEISVSSTDDTDKDVVLIQSSGAQVIQEINFYWQDKDGGASVAGCPNIIAGLPVNWPATCETGILRLDLVPFGTVGPTTNPSRTNLIDRQMTAFLYPMTGADTTVDYTSASGLSNQGRMVQGGCNAAAGKPRLCRVTVTGLGVLGSDRFYARLKGIYGSSAVTITLDGVVGVGENIIETKNYQVKIDSTGKANDVLRRVQVYARINETLITEAARQILGNGFAVQTRDTVCKRAAVAPPNILLFSPPATTGNVCDPYQP